MKSFYLNEDTIHYIARFLEDYKDKIPNAHHKKCIQDMRDLSNHLIDELYIPTYITVIRHPKQ